MPRTSPSELTISVTTRPHPPSRFTRRRKAVSVIPAIGASANGGDSEMDPILGMDEMSVVARRQDGMTWGVAAPAP